tara:strand:+ start:2989 stop:3789 length:801 start_codon:yes stop_codon:yes gene_type:complete
MFAIIVSSKDPAGLNIKENLISLGFEKTNKSFQSEPIYTKDNISLYTTKQKIIETEHIDKEINASTIIFASKHQSESGTPTLCCHFPGNFGKAAFGGKEKQVCPSTPLLLKKAYLKMKSLAHNEAFEVTLEVTHHGPLIDTPCMFIEIGSTENEWKDKEAGNIIANTIIHIIESKLENQKIALGLGGNHYCSQFNKILEKTDIALSHICAKYNLEDLDKDLLKQAIKKSGKIDFILADWKNLSSHKQKITELCKELKLELKRTNQL